MLFLITTFALVTVAFASASHDARADRGNAAQPAIARVGALNDTTNMWGIGTHTTAEITFIMDIGGNEWALGDGLRHPDRDIGTFNFTASDDRDFTRIAKLLTNGYNDTIGLMTGFDGGGGRTASEWYWLGRNPDLVGYAIDYIYLVILDLSLRPEGGGTRLNANVTWEIYASPVFVAFVPPTDSDGAYLIDRDSTLVRVVLGGPGTAWLEWLGVNETMQRGGVYWHLGKTGLANGVYTYRVWAEDAASNLHSSEMRRLTVGVGIWILEDVAPGWQPALTYDWSNAPHMCFMGGAGLTHAIRTTDWVTETADVGGRQCSIQVDSRGTPHISHEWDQAGSSNLRYTTHNGIDWASETIEAVGFTTWTSLALDSSTEQPLVAYYESLNKDLKIARHAGAWSTEVVNASGNTGIAPSLAIDSQGRPRIAYYNGDTRAVEYAAWDGASWRFSLVDSPWFGWEGTISLALDANDTAYVAYAGPPGLRLAVENGSSWDIETVDTRRVWQTSLAFDSSSKPIIAFGARGERSPEEDLWFARRDPSWRFELVANNYTMPGVSLAVNRNGNPAIAFLSSVPGPTTVRFAYRRPFLADPDPPTTLATLSGTRGRAGWFLSSVNITLTATDASSGVAETRHRLDAGSWHAYSALIRVEGDGTHTLEFYSVDVAGNVEPTQSLAVRIDTTSPEVEALAPTGIVTSSRVTLQWATSDETSGVGGYEVSIDGGPFGNAGNGTTIDLSLADGDHVLSLRVIDLAGNTVVAGTRVRVDTNIFSPTGPYSGAPTFFLAAVLGVAVVALTLRWRRRAARARETPRKPGGT